MTSGMEKYASKVPVLSSDSTPFARTRSLVYGVFIVISC